MKTSQRRFSGDPDMQAMLELAHTFPTDNLHVVDLPYRLSSWALNDRENIALWVDAHEQLVAWAIMQTPFWTIDYTYCPDTEKSLHPQILAWAEHRACKILDTPSGHPCWFVMVFADQADRVRDLERAGFVCQANSDDDSWSKVLMFRSAQIPVKDYTLPTGFSIRPLAGESKV